jgi:hypothetical protein
MKWHPSSIYDFPTAIVRGMSEAAHEWRTKGLITKAADEPVRFFFSCTEPKPKYADELLLALRNKIRQPYKSELKESTVVEVVGTIETADVAVTFYLDAEAWRTTKPTSRQGLSYIAVIKESVITMGWFCDDDHT